MMSCSFVSACLAFSRPMKFGPSFHVLHFQSKRITIRILWTSQDFISGHLGGDKTSKASRKWMWRGCVPPENYWSFPWKCYILMHFHSTLCSKDEVYNPRWRCIIFSSLYRGPSCISPIWLRHQLLNEHRSNHRAKSLNFLQAAVHADRQTGMLARSADLSVPPYLTL